MNIIDDVMLIEIRNQESVCKKLKEQLESLPKGTLFFFRHNKHVYVYRKWREDGKVKSQYIGKVGDAKTMEQVNKINEYKTTLIQYKKAVSKLKELQKAYKLLIVKTKLN